MDCSGSPRCMMDLKKILSEFADKHSQIKEIWLGTPVKFDDETDINRDCYYFLINEEIFNWKLSDEIGDLRIKLLKENIKADFSQWPYNHIDKLKLKECVYEKEDIRVNKSQNCKNIL